jgi:hypothetical protein
MGQNVKTLRQLRDDVIAIRERWYRREVTREAVHAIVDECIAAVMEHAKKKGLKIRQPGRAYILRAI